jgi:hypothetical protein
MAKPNYSFEKRQRELARKKKQEAKRERKAHKAEPANTTAPAEESVAPPAPTETK